MVIPPAKYFQHGDRLYVQAQRIWLILVAHVMRSTYLSKRLHLDNYLMTYGELAQAMGYSDPRAGHMLGRQLGIVGRLCVGNNLPPLNTVVVNQETRLPGNEVVLRRGKKITQEQRAVMAQDWFAIRVPTTGTFRKVWENSSQL